MKQSRTVDSSLVNGFVRWTPAEDEFLRKNLTTMTRRDLAECLGRSRNSINLRVRTLDLQRSRRPRQMEAA